MKDQCPCVGCKDRVPYPNCHSTCYDRYIPWAERRNERKEKERQIKKQEYDFIDYNIKNCMRNKKKNKWADKR